MALLHVFSRLHPFKRKRITALAARTPVWVLLLAFVGLIVVSAAMLAALERPSTLDAFLRDWVYFGGFFVGAEELFDREEPLGIWWVPILAGVIRMLLHAVLLGVVVFKLLVPQKLFVFRKRLFVRRNAKGDWELLIRLYNATAAELVDLTFEAFVRTPTLADARPADPSMPAVQQTLKVVPFVSNARIALDAKKDWPISIKHVPYSLPIALEPGDVCGSGTNVFLRRIQGHSITPMGMNADKGEAFLVVIARGRVPSLGSEFVDTHWFQLSGEEPAREYEFGDFHDIMVQPGSKPRQAGGRSEDWEGWKEFDEARPVNTPKSTRQMIFGYGSLVDVGRLSEFLNEHGLALGDYRYVTITGWRRSWSVAMDNRDIVPEYKYYIDRSSGTNPDVYVAFLNIERVRKTDVPAGAPPPEVAGVLFDIDESVLAVLDKRERNYCRCDITDQFPGIDGRVWVYLGSPDAEERYRVGLMERSVVIDSAYKQSVESAYRNAGIVYTVEQDARLREMDLKRIDT